MLVDGTASALRAILFAVTRAPAFRLPRLRQIAATWMLVRRAPGGSGALRAFFAAVGAVGAVGCVGPALPCASSADCGAAACVAGLCQRLDNRAGEEPAVGTGRLEGGAIVPSTEDNGPVLESFAAARRLVVEARRVVGDAPLVGFPLLVQLALPALRGAQHGGLVQSSTGEDIAFFDAGGALLARDIETWDGVTGTLTAWVKLPALSASTGAELWVAFGRDVPIWVPPADVWDSQYVGVWHMGDAPSAGLIRDATSSGADGHPENLTDADRQPAIIGDGLAFERMESAVDVVVGGEPSGGEVTIEAWSRVNTGVFGVQSLFRTADGQAELSILSDGDGGTVAVFDVADEAAVCDLPRFIEAGLGGTLDGWHHYAGVLTPGQLGQEATGVLRQIYVDGVLCDEIGTLDAPVLTAAARLGNGGLGLPALDGAVDEVRVSRAALSEEWLATAAANVTDPTGFVLLQEPEGDLAP